MEDLKKMYQAIEMLEQLGLPVSLWPYLLGLHLLKQL